MSTAEGRERPGRALLPRAGIQVPVLPASVVDREVLLGHVQSRMEDDCHVLLVRAAAGYGKTTLLAQWAHRVLASGRPVAWLACTEAGADPAALFDDLRDALALALRRSAPRTSRALLELAAPGPTSVGSEVASLLMLLDELEQPPALVLDDLHAIAGAPSLGLLESVLTGLPATACLALGTRGEPLSLLTAVRLRTSPIEVAEADLALTRDEVAAVVALAGADPATLTDALLAQTEGWPAAVRLGVLAARGAPVGPGPRDGLPLSYDPSVADYLTREIEAALPAEALALLRDTAVVAELTPALAAELGGRADAGQLLEQLFLAQALVRRTGTTEPTYVVHGLLRAHLLRGLAEADVGAPARQHAAAARWLADQGQPQRALPHAVAARDVPLVADLLRDGGARLLATGAPQVLLDALGAIPAEAWDAELAGLAAFGRAAVGDLQGARGALLRGTALPARARSQPAPPAPPGLLRIAAFHLRRLAGNPEGADIPRAFADVLDWPADPRPARADLDRALLLLVTRGQWRYATGRYDASWADLRLALDLATTHRRDHSMLLALSTLAAVPALVGDAAGEDRYVTEALTLIEDRGWATHPALANLYTAGAWAASLMLLPQRAEHMLGQAHEALRGNVDPEYATYTALADATGQASGSEQEVAAAMATLARFAQGAPGGQLTPALRGFAAMQRVRLMLLRGDPAAAQAAVDDFHRWFPGEGDPVVAQAQVLVARGMWQEGLAEVAAVRARHLPVGVPLYQVVLPMLESIAEERLGRRSAARGALLRALAVAAPREVIRPFWEAGPVMRGMLERQRGRFGAHDDFVELVLTRWDLADAAMTPGRPVVATRDGVALTPRELEVLTALPSLMTAEEMAVAQMVSVNTIRTHMRALYRKLGVRTRRDAVRRGRELGLLGEARR